MPFPLALLLESPSPVHSVPLTQETVLIRPPPRALGIKASQPGLTVASGAVTLSPWSWLCASLCPAGPRAVPLPGPGRGILFPHRWPVSAACSQGTCTTKRQDVWLEACRLAQPDQAGYCHTSACCSRGSPQGPSGTGRPSLPSPVTAVWTHCLFLFCQHLY